MRRVVNEFTANEVNRGTGVKIGDYGTGGRSYRSYERRVAPTQLTEEQQRQRRQVVTGCCGIFAVVVLIYVEYMLALVMGTISEAIGAFSYGLHLKLDPTQHGRLVHLSTTSALKLTDMPPSDFAFGIIAGPDDVILERMTEYCQWMEIEHHHKEKVGKDPDYCAQESNEGECARVSCSGASQSSCFRNSECCRWRQGADIYKTSITYSYVKGWRPYRINSLMFDNPVAYHNPQRDPYPSTKFSAQGSVDLTGGSGGIFMYPNDIIPILQPPKKLFLAPSSVDNSYQSLQEGFSEVSHEHFYSRVSQDGLGHPIIKAVGAYLIDGVVDVNSIANGIGLESLLGKAGLDWITKGTCTAGDIRVSYHTRALPSRATVLGQQVNNKIVAHTYTNGHNLLMLQADTLSIDGLVASTKRSAESDTWYQRVGVYASTLIVISIFGSTNFFEALAVSTLINTTTVSALWLYFYGLSNLTGVILGLSIVGIVAFVHAVVNPSKNKTKTKGL